MDFRLSLCAHAHLWKKSARNEQKPGSVDKAAQENINQKSQVCNFFFAV